MEVYNKNVLPEFIAFITITALFWLLLSDWNEFDLKVHLSLLWFSSFLFGNQMKVLDYVIWTDGLTHSVSVKLPADNFLTSGRESCFNSSQSERSSCLLHWKRQRGGKACPARPSFGDGYLLWEDAFRLFPLRGFLKRLSCCSDLRLHDVCIVAKRGNNFSLL